MPKIIPKTTLFLIALTVIMVAGPTAWAGDRIVVVGDIHGEYNGLIAILQRAELIDGETHWIGGETTLVQTGDLFDRGFEVRRVLDFMMRLHEEAAAAGGKVVSLFGNHETMNLTGYFRDVNPETYATFADKNSEKRRKKELRAFKQYWQVQSAGDNGVRPSFPTEIRERWLAAHPIGLIEYQEMIGPDGYYGGWLRTFSTVAMIDGVVFVHGGIGPEMRDLTVDEINVRVADEIATYDRLRAYMLQRGVVPTTAGLNSLVAASLRLEPPDRLLADLADVDNWFLISPDGPLWFRGTANWDEEEQGDEMKAILDKFGADYTVTAHTPRASARIEVRFDGRAFLIDTGMLKSHYGGQPSALVIEDGVFTAIYVDDETEVLVDTTLADAA